MKPTLILLAAGMGSRYGGLKQLEPLGPNGETLMDYSVHDALHAGFGRAVFVIRREMEAEFTRVVASRYQGIIDMDYAFQELDRLPAGFTVPAGREKPWGTGQALLAAQSVVQTPFAVINADDFYGRESFVKLAGYLGDSTLCVPGRLGGCMCGFELERTLSENGSVSRGICTTDERGNLSKVVENTRLSRADDGKIYNVNEDGTRSEFAPQTLVSMNCWGFTPELFGELERLFAEFLTARGSELKSEFYIPFAVDQLIRAGRITVKMLTTRANWFGITYREDREATMAALRRL